VAFSGVTLIFLLPAMLFAAGAVQVEATRAREEREGMARSVARALLSLVVAACLVGAGAAVLLVTDSACWNTYETIVGNRFEVIPFSNELSVPPGAIASGCSTGLISVRGVGLALVLWLGAFGLADVISRRPGAKEVVG
jgi:hypothetical protein